MNYSHLNSKRLILKWIDRDLINFNNILQHSVRREFFFFDEEIRIIKLRKGFLFHIHNTEDYKLVPMNIWVVSNINNFGNSVSIF